MSKDDLVQVKLGWFDCLGCKRSLVDLKSQDGPAIAATIAEGFHGLQWWLREEVLTIARKEVSSNSDWWHLWSKPLPVLPRVKGSCSIVMANEVSDYYPLLREAFLLPLQWVAHPYTATQPAHSGKLPPRLHALADDAIQDVVDPRKHERRWSLRLPLENEAALMMIQPSHAQRAEPNPKMTHDDKRRSLLDSRVVDLASGFDFSEFDADWGSGWAALTSGLLAAMHGGMVQTDVWATGDWAAEQIQEVKGLDRKLALGVEWGAKVFFVPYMNRDDAHEAKRKALREIDDAIGALEIAGDAVEAKRRRLQGLRAQWDTLQIRLIPDTLVAKARYARSPLAEPGMALRDVDEVNEADAEKSAEKEADAEKPAELVLKALTAALGIEPTQNDPLKDRCDWFLSYSRRDEAEDYYYKYLIRELAQKCREDLDRRYGADALANALLVTIPSTSWVSLLGAWIVNPKACLALHTDDDDQLKPRLADVKKAFRDLLGLEERKGLEFRAFRNRKDTTGHADPEHLSKQFVALLSEFTAKYPHDPLIVDVTSGTTLMKFSLASLAPEKSRLLIVDNLFSDKRGRFIPGTEIVQLLPVPLRPPAAK
jgi:hypothetical protein